MWLSLASHTILDCPEYKLALEDVRDDDKQMIFIHLVIRTKWTKTLYKRLQGEWWVLRKHITCPLFAHGDYDDLKYEKFLALFGFTPLIATHYANGEPRRIFWHQGNDPVNTIH